MMRVRNGILVAFLVFAATSGCAGAALRGPTPSGEAIQEATLFGYTHLPRLAPRDSVQQRALAAARRDLSRRGESQREWFARVSPEPASGRVVIHLKHESGLRKAKRGKPGNSSGRDHSLAYVTRTSQLVMLGFWK
jgi:hypothetical protein